MIDGQRQDGQAKRSAREKKQSAGVHTPQDKSRSGIEANQGNGSKLKPDTVDGERQSRTAYNARIMNDTMQALYNR